MSIGAIVERIRESSPRFKARSAGAISLLAIAMGVVGEFLFRGRLSSVAYFLATSCNIVVTLLFYDIFKPVNRVVSRVAALFGLMVSIADALKWHPQGVDIGLIFLDSYYLLIGYLIFRSAFLPRILSALVAFAGLAWLTAPLTPLAHYLSPYNLAAGVLGQVSLTLWLLVMGVNVQRWKEQASSML